MVRHLYAAYGSNLHPLRLNARIPTARFRYCTVLRGYALRFDKPGSDGSAKANIVRRAQARVNVAVYAMGRSMETLDGIEGSGYDRVPVVLADGQTAWTYVANRTKADLAPFGWYRDLIWAGARYHRFERSYCERIENIEVRRDRNETRATRNAQMIAQALAALSGR
ncbi:MAG: gamma-glutamylcyclotransferase family protein [Myxococcota bacterium]